METTEILKSRSLAKKLSDYMVENNIELYKYLADKRELEDFITDRSNTAFDSYNHAVSAGFPAPAEISNQILFCGMENSYGEYIESLLMENEFREFYNKLRRKPGREIDTILETLVFACMGVFYEYLGSSYDSVIDELDEKLIAVLEYQTKLIIV